MEIPKPGRYPWLQEPEYSTGKALFMLMDGTANSAASGRREDITNVYLSNIYLQFNAKDRPQVSFYHPGVGTRGDRLSYATGRGLDHIIREAYVNVAANYTGSDTLDIIGFSRGAAAARGLAAMIADVGLLRADKLEHLATVWELFVTKRTLEARPRRRKLSRELPGDAFAYSPGGPPIIDFIGLFDNVPGTYWDLLRLVTKFRITGPYLESSVKVGVQILSMDDDRNPSFKPLLWSKKRLPYQTLEQIWMPGVHADIGGASACEYLSNIALLTMFDRLLTHCRNVTVYEVALEKI